MNLRVLVVTKDQMDHPVIFHSLQFSSIYLRNVTLFDPPQPMLFEEKAEVLFERVKVDDNVLDIEWVNENNKLDPIFRLEHCMFEGIDDVADGITGTSTFTFIGENKQLINDGDECAQDYKGCWQCEM